MIKLFCNTVIACMDTFVVYQHRSLGKFFSTIGTLLLLQKVINNSSLNSHNLLVRSWNQNVRGLLKRDNKRITALTHLHPRASLPMSFQVGRVPEVFLTDVTLELPLSLMAEHVLVKAPSSSPLKLFSTNLNSDVRTQELEWGECQAREQWACAVENSFGNFFDGVMWLDTSQVRKAL